jgi:hypothetical protein
MKQFEHTRFLSILFVALTMAPSVAHLLELPNKLSLPADDYLTVQQIYRGWATSNWTILPNNWTHLRAQWEYSHAAGALLNLSAFLALLFAASRRGDAPSKRF